jgi:hypothetical protein
VVFAARRRSCGALLTFREGRPAVKVGHPDRPTRAPNLRASRRAWRSLVERSGRGVSFDATMMVFPANQPTELPLLILADRSRLTSSFSATSRNFSTAFTPTASVWMVRCTLARSSLLALRLLAFFFLESQDPFDLDQLGLSGAGLMVLSRMGP